MKATIVFTVINLTVAALLAANVYEFLDRVRAALALIGG